MSDFDKFLGEETARQQQEQEQKAQSAEITRAVMHDLVERGVPALLHYDNDEIERRRLAYIEGAFSVGYAGLSQIHPELSHDDLTQLSLKHADEWYHAKEIDEMMMVQSIITLIEADRGVKTSNAHFATDKKEFLANEIIIMNRSIDDPWIQYVMEVVPGENLDMSSERDQQYITDAMAKIAQQEASMEQVKQAYFELCTMLGIDGDPVNMSLETDTGMLRTIHEIITRSISAYAIAHEKDNAKSVRDSEIWRLAREQGIDTDKVHEIFRFLDEKWPVQTSGN